MAALVGALQIVPRILNEFVLCVSSRTKGRMLQLIGECFGYAAVVVNLSWPMMRQRQWLLAGQGLACALMLTHFVILGAYTGALIMAVVGTQALLAIPLGTLPRFKLVYLMSLGLIPLVVWLTWQGLPSVFSALALVCASLGNYQLDVIKQRMGLILTIVAWFVHNAWVGSIPGMLSTCFGMMVSLFMLRKVWRERVKAQAKDQNQTS